jgi:hypothetical protein
MAVSDTGFMDMPNMPEGTGVKQRLRYRFADAGQWPIDLAISGRAVPVGRQRLGRARIVFRPRARMGPQSDGGRGL